MSFFCQPTIEQIDTICSFVETDLFSEYFEQTCNALPEHLMVTITGYMAEIFKSLPDHRLIDMLDITNIACINYCELDEMFSLDDYMATNVYVPLLNDLSASGFKNAREMAQDACDNATIAVRIYLADLDNLLTVRGIPHVTGYGSVWRATQITEQGVLLLSRQSGFAISSQLGL